MEIYDLQGSGFRPSELCVAEVLLKYKKGQRNLLTQTSEGGWRVPTASLNQSL